MHTCLLSSSELYIQDFQASLKGQKGDVRDTGSYLSRLGVTPLTSQADRSLVITQFLPLSISGILPLVQRSNVKRTSFWRMPEGEITIEQMQHAFLRKQNQPVHEVSVS